MSDRLHPEQPTPVPFLHGGGVSAWMWRPVLDLLDASWTPETPDLPGHGARWQEAYRSHRATAAELAEWIQRTHPTGVHVVGFSLGAQLAVLLASHSPVLVRSAIIVSAETVPAPAPRATLALLSASAPLARRPGFARAQARQLGAPDALIEAYVTDSARLSKASLLSSVGANIRFTLPAEWSAYPGPVAVVVGSRERRLMRNSAELTHRALPGSTLHTVPEAGHDVPFTHPEALVSILHEAQARAAS